MNGNFKIALDYLITRDEGEKYTDDPDDSGGPTKFGITQLMYSKFIGRMASEEEMKYLTKEDAGPFYEKVYWNPIQGEQIKSLPKAIAIFDSAVLYGKTRAVKMTQDALVRCDWNIKIDGVMGNETLGALNNVKTEEFISCFSNQILKRISEVICMYPKNEKYRNGWENRANRLLTLSTDPKFNIA